MNSFAWLIPSLTLISMPASLATARTWHVSVDGSGDAPTIQAGIDSANSGDTVLVGPGTYLENINFLGKGISVISEYGPEATTLDGAGTPESVVLFISSESRAALLEGFTITGGVGHSFQGSESRTGGGIHCDLSSPTIRNNIIKGNSHDQVKGGGFFVELPPSPAWSVSPLVEGNLFENNFAYNGGAIGADGGQPIIRNNIFRNNQCRFDGGAIFIWMPYGSPIVERNQFWGNIAPDHGGAIYAGNTQMAGDIVIRYNLFVRNEAYGQGAEFTGSGGAIWLNEFSGVVMNNTIVKNISSGESSCNGSGVVFDRTPADLDFRNNIIALGNQCGIECVNLFGPVENVPGPNILWHNGLEDILYGPNHCPYSWADNVIVTDPLFCGPESDNYSVSVDSPALTGPEPFGVWTSPGCGPGVSIQPTTWGLLKARYR